MDKLFTLTIKYPLEQDINRICTEGMNLLHMKWFLPERLFRITAYDVRYMRDVRSYKLDLAMITTEPILNIVTLHITFLLKNDAFMRTGLLVNNDFEQLTELEPKDIFKEDFRNLEFVVEKDGYREHDGNHFINAKMTIDWDTKIRVATKDFMEELSEMNGTWINESELFENYPT